MKYYYWWINVWFQLCWVINKTVYWCVVCYTSVVFVSVSSQTCWLFTGHHIFWTFPKTSPSVCLSQALPPSTLTLFIYCVSLTVFFVLIKMVNYRLHVMFDEGEVVPRHSASNISTQRKRDTSETCLPSNLRYYILYLHLFIHLLMWLCNSSCMDVCIYLFT